MGDYSWYVVGVPTNMYVSLKKGGGIQEIRLPANGGFPVSRMCITTPSDQRSHFLS